jgi:hypothetical protein
MRNSILSVEFGVFVFALCNVQHSLHAQVITATSSSVEVRFGGETFSGRYAVYQEAEGGITNVNYSAILLIPHGAHPDVSVGLTGKGTSVVTMNRDRFPVDKRRVCRTNARGTILTLYAGELPLNAYKDENALVRATEEIVTKAEPDSASIGSQPIGSEMNSTPPDASSRR